MSNTVKVSPDVEKQQITQVVDEWTRILTCTEPMDREVAEREVVALYTSAGLKRPMDARTVEEKDLGPEIVYCEGPGDYYTKALAFAEKLKATDTAAKDFTIQSAKAAISTPWSDGNWLAADEYYTKFVNPEEGKKEHPVQHLAAFARAAFALATFEKVAFIIERPCKVVFREISSPEQGTTPQTQWHCEDGPVLEWPGGDKLYAIEGFFFDEQVVMHPETQTIEEMHAEENLEMRRIRIERYGWQNYIAKSDAKLIDKRRNDVDGGCYEALCDIPQLEARVFLCTCPTGRVFNLLVPSTTESCEAARAYLVGNPELNEIGRT